MTGMHSAFSVSMVLVIVAAGISFERGPEDRNALAQEAAKPDTRAYVE